MWHKGTLVVALVVALALFASARRLKAPALDKYYIKRANEFHTQWAQETGVVTLESGLQYKVLEAAPRAGAHPGPSDKVLLRFQVFIPVEDPPYRIMVGNNVYQDKETEEWKGVATLFNMSGLLEGWRRGLELMTEGDHWELYIPHHMAYGSLGRTDTRPAIPVFSPLILNVWLDKINPPSPEDAEEAEDAQDANSEDTQPTETKSEAGASKSTEEKVQEEL